MDIIEKLAKNVVDTKYESLPKYERIIEMVDGLEEVDDVSELIELLIQ